MLQMKISRKIILLIAMSSITLCASSQQHYRKDLSLWSWFALYKNFGEKTYSSIQYQLRLDNNISRFNSNNFYFLLGFNPRKRWNFEALYQMNTNHFRDLHTFYGGITYRLKFKKTSIFFRTAFQHNRNHFSGTYAEDHPYNEWRNRIRVKYAFNKVFEAAVSFEPTLFLSTSSKSYFEKVRFTSQFITNINKYQNIRLFFMVQPSYDYSTITKLSNMLGLTYQITLPDKMKHYDKLFDPSMKIKKGKQEEEKKLDRDIY